MTLAEQIETLRAARVAAVKRREAMIDQVATLTALPDPVIDDLTVAGIGRAEALRRTELIVQARFEQYKLFRAAAEAARREAEVWKRALDAAVESQGFRAGR